MEKGAPDLSNFYWILGFLLVANIGTIITMVTYVVKIAFSAGELKQTVQHLVKATDKLERDVNAAHEKLRGTNGRAQ